MSESDDSDKFDPNNLKEIHKEIESYKRNVSTSHMFVSGWDDEDQDVDIVKNPAAKVTDHILWAAEQGQVQTLRELLLSQPDLVHTKDTDGYTPLHRCAYGDHLQCVNVILSFGGRVDSRTQFGWSPLHSAAKWNNYRCLSRLMAAGGDPHSLTDGEQSVFHVAASISHSRSTLVCLLFREDSAEAVDRPNAAGETPRQLARVSGLYLPLFEMANRSNVHIRSSQFTTNPHVYE